PRSLRSCEAFRFDRRLVLLKLESPPPLAGPPGAPGDGRAGCDAIRQPSRFVLSAGSRRERRATVTRTATTPAPELACRPIRSAHGPAGFTKGAVMNPRGAFLAALAVAVLVATDSAHGQCFTEFRASPGSGPEGITTGPDMNLWFTEFDAGSIARILPSAPNPITEFNVSVADIRPAGITAGPDGNLWFV